MAGPGRPQPDANPGQLNIRQLSLADLPGCLSLATRRQWPADESKWRFLLEVSTALGVDAPDGRLCGTVMVNRFDAGLAAIGMLLVSPDLGRRGLGRRLMQAALDYSGTGTVFLYTTSDGRPLYEAMGFREVDRVVKYAGEYRPQARSPGVQVRPAATADLAALASMDEVAFGAGRGRLLARLDDLDALRYVAAASDGLSGYGAAWRSAHGTVIGPLVAADEATAETLADAIAGRTHGPLSVDMPVGCARLARWAIDHGLRRVGDAPLMTAGGRALPGDRGQLFAPLMQALG